MSGYLSQRMRVPLGTERSTGHACPETGIWQAQVALRTGDIPHGNGTDPRSAAIAVTNIFPPYRGNAVRWRLIQYA
jgi:hypothetical protein